MPPPISLHPTEFVEEPRFWVVSELRTGSRNLCIRVWLASSMRNDNIYDDRGPGRGGACEIPDEVGRGQGELSLSLG